MKPNYNAVLILEAIAKAPIPDEVKLQAVNDIERMYTDKEYGEKCFIGDLASLSFDKPSLSVHHLWNQSELGSEFWIKMNQIISRTGFK